MELEKKVKRTRMARSLPKLTSISIDKKLHESFNKVCRKQGRKMGKTIEIMVSEFVKANS